MGSTTGADDGSADRARSLAAWFAQRHPHAHDVSVRDIGGPHASGYSNETVFFRACWNEAGESREARYVARIEPRTPPVYPQQTATAMAAVELQYRVMQAVTRAGGVPVPPLAGYEPGTDLLGAPFYVMGFVDGDVPKDNPVYTSEGFYVDAAPVERYRAIDDGLRVLARLHAIDPVGAGLDWLAGAGRRVWFVSWRSSGVTPASCLRGVPIRCWRTRLPGWRRSPPAMAPRCCCGATRAPAT